MLAPALTAVLCFRALTFASTLTIIVKHGELRVAVQSGAAPYAFIDMHGEHAGSMIDFTKGMEAMDVKLAVLTVLPDFPPNSVRLPDKRLGQGKDSPAFAVRHESANLW